MFFKKEIIKKYRKKLKNIKIKEKSFLQQERNKFLSVLNHDIKTPILAQNQSLNLLLEGGFGLLNFEQKEIIKEIYSSNKFLLEVVLNSIFLTKYEQENPKLNIQKINLKKEILDCCESIKSLAHEKQQNIIVKSNKTREIKLEADREMIQKIFLNIISSSISSGFENSNIEVLIEEKNDSISFCAKNSSIFMSKEKLNSLFEDKKNTKDFNQIGMNLNLNIAKKLIKAHNWDIIAESNNDNSAVFGFVVRK